MSKVSWDFFIHRFPPSFVSKELQSIQTKYLKRSGLAVRADLSVLHRPREDSGMGLKEVAIEHKKQRWIRRHQLETPTSLGNPWPFCRLSTSKEDKCTRPPMVEVCGDG